MIAGKELKVKYWFISVVPELLDPN